MSSTPALLDPRDCDERVRRLLRDWTALQLALARSPERAAEALGRNPNPLGALRAARPEAPVAGPAVEAAVDVLARAGAVLLPLLSPAYPWRVARLADPAPVLCVIGDSRALCAPGVAIVGSRAASAYGLATARALAFDLARAGLVVISGLARGIDAAAHEGALEAGGQTVAVQACGPERVYPRSHRGLAARIARQGAVVTELPPGTPPLRAHFPLRNRLISGMAEALVVVEARQRSGSLVTARHALDQGIDVFAVPGPVTSPTSEGTNRLLRDGAQIALDASDVLESLTLGERGRAGAQRARPQTELLRILQREPSTRDQLGRATGRESAELALELLELELEGWIAQDRDGRLRVIR